MTVIPAAKTPSAQWPSQKGFGRIRLGVNIDDIGRRAESNSRRQRPKNRVLSLVMGIFFVNGEEIAGEGTTDTTDERIHKT
jgi:hypothetical protein